MEDKIEKLLRVVEANSDQQHKWKIVFNNCVGPESDSLFRNGAFVLWGVHERMALKFAFIDCDISKAKQQFYSCAKLDEFLIRKYDEKILDYGINHLTYALLSDSNDLIHRYSGLAHSKYQTMVERGISTPLYILQCLIKDDWAEFEKAMIIMKSKTALRYEMELDTLFFEALAEKNKSKMESILTEFVSPKLHKSRNRYHELLKEFISHPALGYAKLAWIKGIEVEINSELVPRDLLPIKPLDNYINEYDFLKNL